MRDGLKGLIVLVPKVGSIVTSPYVRARETAEIVRRAYRSRPILEGTTLRPESHPKKFESWLREHQLPEILVCVGHEPHLSTLVAWLTTADEAPSIDMKKGGACLVTFDEEPRKGTGRLKWLLGPKELGALK
jgi:phosphohistidine phosphatase